MSTKFIAVTPTDEIAADSPSTKRMFEMFEPTTFPIARSASPLEAATADVTSSGRTENYWCVNKNASEADVKATLDFMNWCVTSEAGTKSMAEDMGFTIPFKTAEAPSNVFVKQDAEYTEAGLTPVSWNFTTMPSEEWKNTLGSALTAYAAGSGSWDDVKSAFVDNWATEKALSE